MAVKPKFTGLPSSRVTRHPSSKKKLASKIQSSSNISMAQRKNSLHSITHSSSKNLAVNSSSYIPDLTEDFNNHNSYKRFR